MNAKTGKTFRGTSALALIGVLCAFAAVDHIDRTKIYYGNPDAFRAPAVVKASTVIKGTADYKTIQKEGVKKGTPRYEHLMEKATGTFKTVLGETAKALGKDLVGEIGAIVIKGKAPVDITAKVVARLNGR